MNNSISCSKQKYKLIFLGLQVDWLPTSLACRESQHCAAVADGYEFDAGAVPFQMVDFNFKSLKVVHT